MEDLRKRADELERTVRSQQAEIQRLVLITSKTALTSPKKAALPRPGHLAALNMVTISYEEQTLIGCAAAGGMFGGVITKALFDQSLLGIALGVIWGVNSCDKKGRLPSWLRAMGRTLLLAFYRLVYFAEDLWLKMQTRRFYARLYRQGFERLEQIDRQFQVRQRMSQLDDRYRVRRTARRVWRRAVERAGQTSDWVRNRARDAIRLRNGKRSEERPRDSQLMQNVMDKEKRPVAANKEGREKSKPKMKGGWLLPW
ncbi:unnamed protein product [Vitrella brassicaformis CCMP3155]|uniref:Uncharacterized protein n=1 Tax=Vitrella brassicaformis (strain CCMP3155) TaxID=1169540 RepID=A0A0G4H3N0_VITBC|nr:unnamed protein product [Vitrella brassicaformis CCMP3155]|eukprot:CEM38336.1 unnamed protein product [Vitrella brassicaformis CCMP3155]